MTQDDIAFADVAELQRLLQRKALSSLELTELYLARLSRYGPAYNAVVTITPERARREARRADAERAAGTIRGPLHGIPYGVKDLLATKDAPTTWGAAPYRHQRFDYDATVVRKLGDAGAVLLAKLAMVELAGGFGYNEADASFTGPGRTPWNRAYWSGGSSSGPGAATAAGLVAFSIGSETAGSILVPSASCGLSGLRPSYGRVSRNGAMALSWTLDKLGPMTRSAAGADIVLRAISGADPEDSTAVTRPFPPLRRRPKVAVVARATEKTMPAVAANFERSVRVLGQFCDVEPNVALPDQPFGPMLDAIVSGDAAAAFRDLIESGRARELRSPSDRTGGYVAYATRAVDYIDAQRQRKIAIAALDRAFGRYDAILAPTISTVAFPIDKPFDKAYPAYPGAIDLIGPGALAGYPALSVPNGFGDHGLPTGLSLLGRPFEEATLSAIGASYQQRTSYHRERPKLAH